MATSTPSRRKPYSARREHLDHAFHCVRLATFARRKGLTGTAARWLHEAANNRHAAILCTLLAGARP